MPTQTKLNGGVYSTSGPGTPAGTEMIYCGHNSALLSLTTGNKYIVTSLYNYNKDSSCYLRDDNGKGINLSSSNFCSIEEWRDKQIDKIIE
jgi:hypothetical protein